MCGHYQCRKKNIENRENPYYLTLQLSANISKKSSALIYRDIVMIGMVWSDINIFIKTYQNHFKYGKLMQGVDFEI